jgi:hypothetical protein
MADGEALEPAILGPADDNPLESKDDTQTDMVTIPDSVLSRIFVHDAPTKEELSIDEFSSLCQELENEQLIMDIDTEFASTSTSTRPLKGEFFLPTEDEIVTLQLDDLIAMDIPPHLLHSTASPSLNTPDTEAPLPSFADMFRIQARSSSSSSSSYSTLSSGFQSDANRVEALSPPMDIEESDVPTFPIGVPVLLEKRDTVDTTPSKPVDIAHRVLSRENVWTGEFSPASSK